MRDSDWSRPNLLRSDWLVLFVAICTTQMLSTAATFKVNVVYLQYSLPC